MFGTKIMKCILLVFYLPPFLVDCMMTKLALNSGIQTYQILSDGFTNILTLLMNRLGRKAFLFFRFPERSTTVFYQHNFNRRQRFKNMHFSIQFLRKNLC